jgi:peroxidase
MVILFIKKFFFLLEVFERLFNLRSHLFPFFGQFIDHDITLTGSVADPDDLNQSLECSCSSTSEDCLKIPTPPGDTVNSDQNCMATSRSARTVSNNGNFKNREQMNIITTWIDLSQIYGSSEEESDNLRLGTDGRLKVCLFFYSI